MKQLIYPLLISAMMLFVLASCSDKDTPDQEVQMTFVASLQQVESRTANNDFISGECVNTLYCAVYEKTESGYEYIKSECVGKNTNGTFTFAPMLVKDKTYKVAFWAMYTYNVNNDGVVTAYDINDELTEIEIPDESTLNDNTLDAFTGLSEDIIAGRTENIKEVELKRPFALLNFATSDNDLTEALTEYEITDAKDIKASVTVSMKHIAMIYSAWDQEITYSDTDEEYLYTSSQVIGEDDGKPNYTRLTSCYVWPPEDGTKTTCIIRLTKDDGTPINTVTVRNVPLTTNYITNIYGELLMGVDEYDVTVQDNTSETNP